MDMAAVRHKRLISKAFRRAACMASTNMNDDAAAAAGGDSTSSVCTVVDENDVARLEDLEDMEKENDTSGSDTETETEKKKETESSRPAHPVLVPKPTGFDACGYFHPDFHPCLDLDDEENDEEKTKPRQRRQTKACTGLIPRDILDEGVSLAFSDEEDDFARIHAANRKAWPRGQEPISARATVEDREIAELVRMGLIGAEDLQVDHGRFDGLGENVLPYTVRFVEAKGRGKKGKSRGSRRMQAEGAVNQNWEAESDWWYLDDEAYAQLLSDGGTELLDWSETSSFVCVD